MNKTNLLLLWVLLACGLTTRAAKWTDSGMYDTSWYSDLGNTFEISTPRQLAGLAYMVINGKPMQGKTFKLVADLDMGENEWVPMTTFEGTLDGDYHRIKNLKAKTDNEYHGFIEKNKGTIMCLMLDQAIVERANFRNRYVGGIAAANSGLITDCVYYGSINTALDGNWNSSKDSMGGIVGTNDGTVVNCWTGGSNNANLFYANMGGIVGTNDGTVYNSYNITTSLDTGNGGGGVGGIVGRNEGIVNNIFNAANVQRAKGNCGAIVGEGRGTTENAYYCSSFIVEGGTINNTGTSILLSQLQNETFDFTGLLNNNVQNMDAEGLDYWCNSPEKFDNEPMLLNGFVIDAINADVSVNTVTLTASPRDIRSSAITAKGFAFKKAGDTEYRHINCQGDLTATVADLDFATDYEVRVFVTTIDGKTIYMRPVPFATAGVSVETRLATNVTTTTATLNGYAPSGISQMKAEGFRWREKGSSETHTVYSSGQVFSTVIKDLYPNTTYEFEAFLQTNNDDFLYGETLSFTTLPLSISLDEPVVDAHSIGLKGSINVAMTADIKILYKKSVDANWEELTVTSNEKGRFEATISGLAASTYYDFKATVSHTFGVLVHTATTPTATCKTLNEVISVQTLTPIIDDVVILRGEVAGGHEGGFVGFELRWSNKEIVSHGLYEGPSFSRVYSDLENGTEYSYRAYYEENGTTTYGNWVLFMPTTLPSGISSAESISSPHNRIFNLQGIELQNHNQTKGLNIIRQADGTTRKIVVRP